MKAVPVTRNLSLRPQDIVGELKLNEPLAMLIASYLKNGYPIRLEAVVDAKKPANLVAVSFVGTPAEKQVSAVELAKRMFVKVPENNPLREALLDFMGGVFLELPEQRTHLMRQLARVVGEHIPDMEKLEQYDPWQVEVIKVWQKFIY